MPTDFDPHDRQGLVVKVYVVILFGHIDRLVFTGHSRSGVLLYQWPPRVNDLYENSHPYLYIKNIFIDTIFFSPVKTNTATKTYFFYGCFGIVEICFPFRGHPDTSVSFLTVSQGSVHVCSNANLQ